MKHIKELGRGFVIVALLGFAYAPHASAQDSGHVEVVQTGVYSDTTGTIIYTIHWKVAGGAVENLVVTDTIPAGTTFVSAESSGRSGNFVYWTLGSRNQGEEGDLTLTVSVDAAQTLNPWASRVVSFTPGHRADGVGVSSSSMSEMLGRSDNTPAPLGLGGSVIFSFDFPAINATGSDITVFSGNGPGASETVNVEASNNLSDWVYLTAISGTGDVDLKTLPEARYFRLTDVTVAPNSAEGFKLDAARYLHIVPAACDIVNKVAAQGFATGAAVQSIASITTDIHAGCSTAYSGSGIGSPTTDTDTDAGGGPDVTPTPVPSEGGGEGGTSGTNTGGSAGKTAGASTPAANGNTPAPGGVADTPPDLGGAPEERAQQVLGATTLPRTGESPMYIALIIVAALLLASIVQMFRHNPQKF